MSKAEIEVYFNDAPLWQKEMKALRAILQNLDIEETYKWKQPCYVSDGKNICIIGAFKAYCVVSFFKGALLQDRENVLEAPGKNSQATKMLRFTSLQAIEADKDLIIEYVNEAIAIEEAGLRVAFKDASTYTIVPELQAFFDEISEFKSAFYALTPGRQKGYLLHFEAAKHSKTRLQRIEKAMDRIYAGKGIQDCICGHSKRMPRCDGSHKAFETKER